MFEKYKKKTKRTKKDLKEIHKLLVLIASLKYFYYVKQMTIFIALVIFYSFQFLHVLLLFSERCPTTTRGVDPPSFKGQLISFHVRALDLFL